MNPKCKLRWIWEQNFKQILDETEMDVRESVQNGSEMKQKRFLYGTWNDLEMKLDCHWNSIMKDMERNWDEIRNEAEGSKRWNENELRRI